MTQQGKVVLRALSEEDTANIVRWRNKDSVRKNLYTQTLLTEEQHLRYFRDVVAAGKCVQYIISAEEEGRICDVGTVFIKKIDRENRKGEFGIFIGEEAFRGKGIAGQAVEQILKIAFTELQLNRVYLSVMADNIPAIRAYRKAGFEMEGILREDYLRADGFVDIVLMGITEKKWREKADSAGKTNVGTKN